MADDTQQVVHEFTKNAAETVKVELLTYRGHELLGIRVYYRRPDGTVTPTTKGLTLSRALMPELETAVQRLRDAIIAGAEAGR